MPTDPAVGAGWLWDERRGDAADLVGADIPLPAVRRVRVVRPRAPVFVLGSTQPETPVVPGSRPRSPDIVRRRSGGGGVQVVPGELVWVDVIVPRDDPWWDDDVGRAAHPIGEAWAATLGLLGLDARVHRGALESTEWSRQLCFAGLGPGEVLVADRKVVGVAQRRTRHGACFQCAIPLRRQGLVAARAAGIADERLEDAVSLLEQMSGSVPSVESTVLDALHRVLTP